jgi:hypothetical protein
MPEHPNAIPLENGSVLTEESHEVARVWITNNAGSSVWIHAGLIEDPRVFGFLMADTVRHAAIAYANTWGIDEVAALQSIADGFVEQLGRQSTAIETLQKGSLNA